MIRRSGAWWRRRIWASASLLMLATHFIGTSHPPRRTEIGTEQYLFGLGDTVPKLIESPQGGAWLLVPDVGMAPKFRPTGSSLLNDILSKIASYRWPNGGGPRLLVPFGHPEGSYVLRGNVLVRVWRVPAARWIAPQFLSNADTGSGASAVLDLRTGRTFFGPAIQSIAASIPALTVEQENLSGADEEEVESLVDPSALEGDSAENWTHSEEVKVGDQAFEVGTQISQTGLSRIVVGTKDEAPRMLVLAENARPLKLSRDGRTLFFEREGALWRLDLVRSLSNLLGAATPPLPEPPEDTREDRPK